MGRWRFLPSIGALLLLLGVSSALVVYWQNRPAPPPSLPPAQPPPPPPTPTLTPPAPPPPPQVNLRPRALPGWAGPLVVAPVPGAREPHPVEAGRPLLVSWSIVNEGPEDIARPFFVDLLVDGVLVERWTVEGLLAGGRWTVEDWEGLLERVRLSPGPHRLSLTVDPTRLIPETDEGDNTASLSFQWPGGPEGTAPSTLPQRLPNLAPFTPPGWGGPLRPPQGDQALLGLAYRNAGLSSIGGTFFVDLYIDDLLVARFRQPGLLAGEGVTKEWGGLEGAVDLPPGPHTLRLVLDPTGLVDESREDDNAITVSFQWGPGGDGGGPSPSPEAGAPAGPRVVPFTPPGWSGPLVVSDHPGLFRTPSVLPLERPLLLHWAVRNEGGQDLSRPFQVEVQVDGRTLGKWERPPLKAQGVDFLLGWPLEAGALPPGPHRLALVVSTGPTGEARVEQEVQRGPPPPSPPPRRYTPEEVQQALARLERLREATGPALPDYLDDILAVADAVYYTLHGRSLRDEDLSLLVLPEEEYRLRVEMECRDTLARVPTEVVPFYRQRCARLQEFGAYMSLWRGRHHLVVRGERPPLQVLLALAHELGHFRQSLENPAYDAEPLPLDLRAVREAQAYAYELLFFRTLERLTGQALLLYPAFPRLERFLDARWEALFSASATDEHARGRLLLWLALLTDPQLRPLRTRLLLERSLPAEEAGRLFRFFLSLPPQEAEGYVARLFRSLDAAVPVIRALTAGRLVPGLLHWQEGHPALRDLGLLSP